MSEKVIAQWNKITDHVAEVVAAWTVLFKKPVTMSPWAYLHFGWRLPWYFVKMLWWMSRIRKLPEQPTPKPWCSRCEQFHGGRGFTHLGPMLQGAVCIKKMNNPVFIFGALIDAALAGCFQLEHNLMIADNNGLPLQIGDIYPTKPVFVRRWYR